MPKFFLSILALISGLLLSAAQQVHQQDRIQRCSREGKDSTRCGYAAADPLSTTLLDGSSKGFLLPLRSMSRRWTSQRNGFLFTVLVDWKAAPRTSGRAQPTLKARSTNIRSTKSFPCMMSTRAESNCTFAGSGLVWDVPGISISTSYEDAPSSTPSKRPTRPITRTSRIPTNRRIRKIRSLA